MAVRLYFRDSGRPRCAGKVCVCFYNKEIGAELFISEATVKSHVKGIFTKLDVVSRTEAIATATRRGLIQL
jgi:DNA-binding NarL/FixJ family response regulator